MKTHLLQLLLIVMPLFVSAQSFVIESPIVDQRAEVKVVDPDELISNLGRVRFVIDFTSANDDLFMLEIRRREFELADGRAASTIAVSKQDGIIVSAAPPTRHISIVGMKTGSGNAVIQAIFYDASNQIISPSPNDIAVFDLTFERQDIEYEPRRVSGPGSMSVSLLLDNSGSMSGFQSQALEAARDFLDELPDFTRCDLYVFASVGEPLNSAAGSSSCPSSSHLLSKVPAANGGTSLMNAIEEGFNKAGDITELTSLVVIVTDGVNTVTPRLSHSDLLALKKQKNVKILVYWIGAHDRNHLKDLADQEIVGRSNVKADLDAFFETVGVNVSGIQSIELI